MTTERIYRWTKTKLRTHLSVVKGERAPTIVLKNTTYLNHARRKWLQANIWVADDRIVYVGKEMPQQLSETEVVDCTGKVVVPGYIEHHAHPFQLYNPHSLAEYASVRGTTTLINDNLVFFLNLGKRKALSLIEKLETLPTSMYWWARYDAQMEIVGDEIFSNSKMRAWLDHHLVVQGGELTSWPKVLQGDDALLHWMQETTRLRKPIEGHLPGASESTLAQMALLGVTCDHESITGEEVVRRLDAGYTTSLRHSSIRPDLAQLLAEMKALGVDYFGRCLMTTDGSSPSFYEKGVMDQCIALALEAGLDPIDAYGMSSYYVARYYRMDHKLGMIAPGRIAHINILTDPHSPTPESVLAKGQWVLKNGEKPCEGPVIPWSDYGIRPIELNFDLQPEELNFSMPMGIEMVNAVILKPYQTEIETSSGVLSCDHDESYFAMIDKDGKWLVTTTLKGFSSSVMGLASTYSYTGDVILIGKSIVEMVHAFSALKAQGGGLVIVENGEVIGSMVLPLLGIMSEKPLKEVMAEEKKIVSLLRKRGYKHADPIYSLQFFSSTHLPYIRITARGIYDVRKRKVLFPAVMRG